uniref:Uncharacterized protein n=1 Tax=Triticum urartu TaxID=4572 RepID=A0A8R7TYV1_TRIUA
MEIMLPLLRLFWSGDQPHGPSHHQHPVLENAVLSAAAGGSVILLFLPLVVWFCTKSMERTLRVVSTSSMWAAVLNSMIWLFFTTVVMDKEDCMELVLAYPIVLASNFIYLMIVYGFINSFKMAIMLSSLVTLSLGYIFYAIRFHPDIPESWEMLGLLALCSLVWSHACLICDIRLIAGLLHYVIYCINVVLSTALNGATFYVIAKNHPDQQFVVYSSLMGFVLGFVEVMILIKKLVDDNFFRAPNDHAPGNGNNGGDNANGNNLQGAGGDNANVNNPQGAGGNNVNVNNPEGAEDDDDDANGNNPQGAGGNNANVNNLQGSGGDNANVNNPQGAGGNNANVNNPEGADDDDDANGNNPQGAGGNNANVNNPHRAEEEDDDDDDSDDDEDDDDNDKDDGDDNDDDDDGDDDEDDANPQGVHGNNLQEDDDLHGDDVADDTVNREEADGEGQPPSGEIWIGIPEGVKVENDTDDDFEDSRNFDATDTDTFYDAVGDNLMKDNMPKLVTPEHKVSQTVSFTPRSKKPSERSSSHRSNGEVKKSND